MNGVVEGDLEEVLLCHHIANLSHPDFIEVDGLVGGEEAFTERASSNLIGVGVVLEADDNS